VSLVWICNNYQCLDDPHRRKCVLIGHTDLLVTLGIRSHVLTW